MQTGKPVYLENQICKQVASLLSGIQLLFSEIPRGIKTVSNFLIYLQFL